MRLLSDLFKNNRRWSERQKEGDPDYFRRLCDIQRPQYLWIGCSDSRVPANTIIGLAPGEVFVHRNVGNLVRSDDFNALSVLQYAIEVLRVSHVIVCGHYGCGGVWAALGDPTTQPLESWLAPIREVSKEHVRELSTTDAPELRWRRLCEFNVIGQVRSLAALPVVREAWQRGQSLALHGWIYDLSDGLLRDLDVTTDQCQ